MGRHQRLGPLRLLLAHAAPAPPAQSVGVEKNPHRRAPPLICWTSSDPEIWQIFFSVPTVIPDLRQRHAAWSSPRYAVSVDQSVRRIYPAGTPATGVAAAGSARAC